MPDAFAYCAELVRAADRDRYLAALFAPAERRPALHALYAFNIEVARVSEVVRQPLAGEIRLQWWTEVLRGERAEEAPANPVADALLAILERYRIAPIRLIDLIEARRFDLYDEPMRNLADLESYAVRTSSVLFALAAEILGGAGTESFTRPAGIAYALAGLIAAFPAHAAQHRIYLPLDVLERHHVEVHDVFAERSSAGLNAALAEIRTVARAHLATAREHRADIGSAALPAMLPVALVRPSLDWTARADAFAVASLPQWRRQWSLWRAARNPDRIAG